MKSAGATEEELSKIRANAKDKQRLLKAFSAERVATHESELLPDPVDTQPLL